MAPSLTPQQLAQVTDLMRRGEKIQAIKLLRDVTGLGLAEAKHYVESLPMSGSYEAPSFSGGDEVGVREVRPATQQQIDAFLLRDELIMAIKLQREATGLGLAEAKKMCEARRAQLRVDPALQSSTHAGSSAVGSTPPLKRATLQHSKGCFTLVLVGAFGVGVSISLGCHLALR